MVQRYDRGDQGQDNENSEGSVQGQPQGGTLYPYQAAAPQPDGHRGGPGRVHHLPAGGHSQSRTGEGPSRLRMRHNRPLTAVPRGVHQEASQSRPESVGNPVRTPQSAKSPFLPYDSTAREK